MIDVGVLHRVRAKNGDSIGFTVSVVVYHNKESQHDTHDFIRIGLKSNIYIYLLFWLSCVHGYA